MGGFTYGVKITGMGEFNQMTIISTTVEKKNPLKEMDIHHS